MTSKNTTQNSQVADPAINELMDQLSTHVSKVTYDDLGGLASLHTEFQKLREEINLAASVAARSDASMVAARSEQLIEKLILGEASDALECSNLSCGRLRN